MICGILYSNTMDEHSGGVLLREWLSPDWKERQNGKKAKALVQSELMGG